MTWAPVSLLPLSLAVEWTLNAGTQVRESMLRMMTEFLLRPESNVTARGDSVMP